MVINRVIDSLAPWSDGDWRAWCAGCRSDLGHVIAAPLAPLAVRDAMAKTCYDGDKQRTDHFDQRSTISNRLLKLNLSSTLRTGQRDREASKAANRSFEIGSGRRSSKAAPLALHSTRKQLADKVKLWKCCRPDAASRACASRAATVSKRTPFSKKTGLRAKIRALRSINRESRRRPAAA